MKSKIFLMIAAIAVLSVSSLSLFGMKKDEPCITVAMVSRLLKQSMDGLLEHQSENIVEHLKELSKSIENWGEKLYNKQIMEMRKLVDKQIQVIEELSSSDWKGMHDELKKPKPSVPQSGYKKTK